jgi:hypothetical protein
MQTLMVLAVFGAAVAIFLTTPAGKKLAVRLGLRFSNKSLASDEDHDYLLRVCNGDFDELSARLKAARGINPELTEAEVYRRAIRTYLRDKT